MSGISDRDEVTKMIRSAKVKKSIKWADVAKKLGKSKEWTTAACLGQMTFGKKQAETESHERRLHGQDLTTKNEEGETR